MSNNLLTEDPKKIYLSYLIPTILAMITGSIYVIVDVAFVSIYLGEQALAAFNIAMPIYTLYSAISLLFGVGSATTMSIFNGMGDHSKSNKILSQSMTLVSIISVIITVLGLIFIEPFAMILGANDALLPLVVEYLFPIHALCLFYIINQCMQIIVRADQNPKLVMIAAILGNGVNIILDYVFVVIFDMGLEGASLATGIGPMVGLSVLSLHYFRKKNIAKFTKFKFDKFLLIQTLKNGAGSSILDFASGSVIFIFNLVLLRVSGSDAVAIYAIISNLAFITKGLFNGLAQASQPIISTNYGAKNYPQMFKAFEISKKITSMVSLFIYFMTFVFAAQIMSMFIGNYTELLDKSIDIVRLYFISLFFTGINTIYMYYFQSTNNSKISVLISISRSFVFILVGLVIFTPLFGEYGVYLSITFAEIITLLWVFPVKQKYNKRFKSDTISN